jgi:hypothetical protein
MCVIMRDWAAVHWGGQGGGGFVTSVCIGANRGVGFAFVEEILRKDSSEFVVLGCRSTEMVAAAAKLLAEKGVQERIQTMSEFRNSYAHPKLITDQWIRTWPTANSIQIQHPLLVPPVRESP